MIDVSSLLGAFFGAAPVATLATVFIFDVPRDLLALAGVAFGRARKPRPVAEENLIAESGGDVTVIVASLNDPEGVLVSLDSLRSQQLKPARIIVFSDGSTDHSMPVLSALQRRGDIDMVVFNNARLGRAAAGNVALQYVETEFVLFIDCDTRLDPEAIKALRRRMLARPQAAACSGNIGVSNHKESLWAGLQQLEYMISIDFGREFSDTLGAVACCSGALTMYRSTMLSDAGGFSSGSGEDLATTLRLRRMGHEVHFEADAWAQTAVPSTLSGLIGQRLRWDRDAFRIQIVQFHQLRKQRGNESLANTIQRYDFILFTFLPTLMMPLFLPILTRVPSDVLPSFLAGGYIFLVLLAAVILAPVFIGYRGQVSVFQLMLLPIFPLYQGIFMKIVRLYAYLSEAIFHASAHDGYVPARLRRRFERKQ